MAARAVATSAKPEPSTRDVILDRAEIRFADFGFAAVSMRAIAAEAGLRNQASLYNHFRNKRALYEAVLARGVAPILAIVAASGASAAGSRDAAARTAFVDDILDYFEEHPHLPRLIQRAALDDSRYLKSTLARLLRPLYERGLGVLESTADGWDPADLPHLGAGLYLLIFGYFANAKLLGLVFADEPLGARALGRQRRFLKAAVVRLIGAPRTLGVLRVSAQPKIPATPRKGRTR
jgi:TetR/AcrR family transcriptional regulator